MSQLEQTSTQYRSLSLSAIGRDLVALVSQAQDNDLSHLSFAQLLADKPARAGCPRCYPPYSPPSLVVLRMPLRRVAQLHPPWTWYRPGVPGRHPSTAENRIRPGHEGVTAPGVGPRRGCAGEPEAIF